MSYLTANTDTIVADVYETTNYGQFKHIATNRNTVAKNVAEIIKSMNLCGWLGAPIVVNENMEIIDGQNREEAAEASHTAVRYMICPGYGIDECIALNVNGSRWTTTDYITSWARRGLSTYTWLKEMAVKYRNVYLDNITAIAYNKGKNATNSSTIRRYVREGKLCLTKEEMDTVEEVVGMISTIYADFCKKIGGKQYVLYNAILFAYNQPYVDGDKLANIFVSHYQDIVPAFRTEDYLAQIDRLYNEGIPYKSGKRVCCHGDYITLRTTMRG